MDSPIEVSEYRSQVQIADDIVYAARRIIERSTDSSITAEARRIVHLTQQIDRLQK
ncbi:hypothetical protein [Nocardia sp. NPDC005366]|uniref:hypothetical protein n=1 Tax=Nocardia sp. NPDC005366 TaxID=3156878 RepID=UPI0033BA503C